MNAKPGLTRRREAQKTKQDEMSRQRAQRGTAVVLYCCVCPLRLRAVDAKQGPDQQTGKD